MLLTVEKKHLLLGAKAGHMSPFKNREKNKQNINQNLYMRMNKIVNFKIKIA